MIYNYISSEVVIAQVLSDTKITDTTYADDMLEWLGEGMDMIKVYPMLVPTHKLVEVNDNVGKLPCGVVFLDGVLYNGQRLRQGFTTLDLRRGDFKKVQSDPNSYFTSDYKSEGWTENEQSYLLLRGDDIKGVELNTGDFYIPTPNYVQTSFKRGCIQLFYRSLPIDERGYPLIPKEQKIKQALFWWIMSKLALTGYKHNDPRMDYDYCEAKFEKYALQGKTVARKLSVDKKESIKNMWVSLIPPTGYYESFGVGMEQPKYISK